MVAESTLSSPATPESPHAASWRELLIDRIIELNPGAEFGFLDGFAEPALERYANHLENKLEPRGTRARWVRTNETPAVIGWRAQKEKIDRLW